jgi:radical SAM protein with 4Fe4S-binding SPASM domain
VCGNPAAFDDATAGVRRLVAAGVNTEVRSTISRDNVGDIEALHGLAFELVGNRAFETSLTLTPPVRGACTKAATCRLSPKEIAALGAKGEGSEPDPGVEGDAAMTVSRLSGAIDRPPAGAIDYSALPPMFCSGGRSSFWIAWDGRMLPCALMDRPFTQPFETGFSPAWRKLVEETDRIPGAEDCRSCADRGHCSVCPGRLQAETGSFTKPAPFLCELARRVHEQEAAAQ